MYSIVWLVLVLLVLVSNDYYKFFVVGISNFDKEGFSRDFDLENYKVEIALRRKGLKSGIMKAQGAQRAQRPLYCSLSSCPRRYFDMEWCIEGCNNAECDYHRGLCLNSDTAIINITGLERLFPDIDFTQDRRIPDEIGRFTNLTRIQLSGMEGTIPSSLGELTNLQVLMLKRGNIYGAIPSGIGNLKELVFLDLNRNQLEHTPPLEVVGLEKLYILDLQYNRLFGQIPVEYGDFKAVEFLGLAGNRLTGQIPGSLGKIRGLVSISNNFFDGTLPKFPEGAQITRLIAYSNPRLVGPIPPEFFNAESLVEIDVGGAWTFDEKTGEEYFAPGGNFGTVTQVGWKRLKKVYYLNFENTNLTGEIPLEFCEMTSLVNLRMYTNNLTGTIPSCLGKLPNLVEIELAKNKLSGPIPIGLFDLPQLDSLKLAFNQLTGTIPTEVGKLSLLTRLALNRNFLSSTIPSELFKLKRLEFLHLDDNRVEGKSNGIYGTIPSELGTLPLIVLGLRKNGFYGTIPKEIRKLSNTLGEMFLTLNFLTGGIPPEISQLVLMDSLDLEGNENLGGTIPSEIGKLSRLTHLNLFNTNVTGAVPRELGNLSNLEVVSFKDNRVKSLPTEIGRLGNLLSLDVSGNQLTSVPEEIGELENLDLLRLHQNQIKQLPPSIIKLTKLRVFGISNNPILCDCKVLEWFDVLPTFNALSFAYEFLESTRCGNWNEYNELPLSRLQISPNGPCRNPENVQLTRKTNSSLEIEWDYKSEVAIETTPPPGNNLTSSWDCKFPVGSTPNRITTPGVLGYRIEWWENNNNNGDVGEARETKNSACFWTPSKFRLEGLAPFRSYQIQVAAVHVTWETGFVDNFGITSYWSNLMLGPKSLEYSFQTDESLPGSPPIFNEKLTLAQLDSVTIAWDPPTLPNGKIFRYEIQYWLQPPTNITVGTKTTTRFVEEATFIVLSGLLPETSYMCRIRAINSIGPGPWSESVVFSTQFECSTGFEKKDDICVPCESRKYRGIQDGPICIQCPANRPLTKGTGTKSIGECFPERNSFIDEDDQVQSCFQAFQRRVDCSEIGTTIRDIQLLPGYWRISELSYDIRKCRNGNACLGGNNSNAYCVENHKGVLCSQCEEGYGIARSLGVCKFCDESAILDDRTLIFVWGFLCIITVISPSLYLIYITIYLRKEKHNNNNNNNNNRGDIPEIEGEPTPNNSTNSADIGETKSFIFNTIESVNRIANRAYELSMVKFRILIGFYQVVLQYIITLGLFSEDVPYYQTTESYNNNGNIVVRHDEGIALETERLAAPQLILNLDISAILSSFSVGCYREVNYYDLVLVYTMMPIISFSLMFLTNLYVKKRVFPGRDDLYLKVRSWGLWMLLMICFLIYPGVSSSVLRLFLFQEFPRYPGDREPNVTVYADPTMDFNAPQVRAFRLGYGIPMILLYPVGILILFGVSAHLYAKATSQDKRIQAVAFLCSNYRSGFEWFETYELFRKLILTSIFVFVDHSIPFQARIIFCFMCMIFLFLVLRMKPYKEGLDQAFAEMSIFLLALVSFSSSLDPFNFGTVQVIIFAVIVEFILFAIVVYLQSKNPTSNTNNNNQSYVPHYLDDEVDIISCQRIVNDTNNNSKSKKNKKKKMQTNIIDSNTTTSFENEDSKKIISNNNKTTSLLELKLMANNAIEKTSKSFRENKSKNKKYNHEDDHDDHNHKAIQNAL